MSYVCLNDLKTAFGEQEILQLADRNGDGHVDSPVVDRAIKAATDEINTYLSSRYDLPLALVPGHLKTIAGDIARYRLFAIAPDGEPQDRYNDAVRWLRDLAAGRAELPGVEPSIDSSSAPGVGRVRFGQAAGMDLSNYP